MSGSDRAPNRRPSKPDFSLASPRRGAAANAERERFSRTLGGRGPGEGAGDRVVPQRRKQFAGDEGLEGDDAIAVDLRPFRMRAWQHDQSGAGIGDAEDFRFLAPHYIRLRGFIDIGQAGRQMNAPAGRLDLRELRGDLAGACRAFDVSCLAPTMPASDHARGDNRQRRMGLEPSPDQSRERRWIRARRDAPDPIDGVDLVENVAIGRHEIGAEARRSPVNGDEHGRHRGRLIMRERRGQFANPIRDRLIIDKGRRGLLFANSGWLEIPTE